MTAELLCQSLWLDPVNRDNLPIALVISFVALINIGACSKHTLCSYLNDNVVQLRTRALRWPSLNWCRIDFGIDNLNVVIFMTEEM